MIFLPRFINLFFLSPPLLIISVDERKSSLFFCGILFLTYEMPEPLMSQVNEQVKRHTGREVIRSLGQQHLSCRITDRVDKVSALTQTAASSSLWREIFYTDEHKFVTTEQNSSAG